MRRFLRTVILVAAVCSAADFSGNWAGNADVTVNGERVTRPLFFTLKQDGANLTGTAGHSKSEQRPIKKGKVEGETITFEVQPEEEDAPLMIHRLTLKGNRLVGTVTGKNADTEVTANLELEREK